MSAALLFAVTVYVIRKSIEIIKSKEDNKKVSIPILFGFAAANGVIDFFVIFLFYLRGPDVFYLPNNDTSNISVTKTHIEMTTTEIVNDIVRTDVHNILHSESDGMDGGGTPDIGFSGNLPERHKNTNMVSAFTHASGDTLRTIAIFVAAFVATLSDVHFSTCDAYAAIVVSFTILVILVPLCKEILVSTIRI